MKQFVFICILWGAATSAWAADDCVFDQEHQVKVLTTIAKLDADAKIDREGRTITWSHPVKGTTTFGYGGCAHFGSVVSLSTPLSAARTQAQVFAVARDLATRYWGNKETSLGDYALKLVVALDRNLYEIEKMQEKTVYSARNQPLQVEHEYKNGVDIVSVAWRPDL